MMFDVRCDLAIDAFELRTEACRGELCCSMFDWYCASGAAFDGLYVRCVVVARCYAFDAFDDCSIALLSTIVRLFDWYCAFGGNDSQAPLRAKSLSYTQDCSIGERL